MAGRLVEPKLKSDTHGFVDWMEDVGNTIPGFIFNDGKVLVSAELLDRPHWDNGQSIRIMTCSTFPDCPSCTKREKCPASNYKK